MPTFSLGDAINGSPHSVCVSLPTMAAVVGYEEHDPEVRGALNGGYPRFVEPRLRRDWQTAAASAAGDTTNLWRAVASRRVAETAANAAGGAADGVTARSWREHWFVVSPPGQASVDVKCFLQHTGGALSTRAAEAALVDAGLLATIHEEERWLSTDGAEQHIRVALAAEAGIEPANVVLAQSGMNAFYATWQAINAAQARRGRPPRWLRLGWLYVDTMKILENLGPAWSKPLEISSAQNLAAVEAALAAEPEGFAGIIVEVPGNPLAESPDIAALSALAQRYGVALVLDPSLASLWNVRVLAAADVVVTSLTKYAAAHGDVLGGAALINPARPWASELATAITAAVEPLAAADAARLAVQIGHAPEVVARINAGARVVARFLAQHPVIEDLRWAERPGEAERFAAIRALHGGPGSIITFTIRGTGGLDYEAGRLALAPFYDRVELAKSPSFGTAFTMLCPYLYLAHFDLVNNLAGRAYLIERGLNPELIRLSLGTEDPAEIVEALARGLS